MPIIYPKNIRRKFKSLDLNKLKNRLIELGYEFIRDGGFRPEDEPFKFSNYLFYEHPEIGLSQTFRWLIFLFLTEADHYQYNDRYHIWQCLENLLCTSSKSWNVQIQNI